MRLDQYLVLCGLVESRTLAQRLIEQGEVIVNGQVTTKSSVTIADHSRPVIEILKRPTYVSRGGEKLEAALAHFAVNPLTVVIDIGASTGGFTDCLLQHGAELVYAVDVGHDQLHPSLRQNQRVKSFEGANIRQFSIQTLTPPPQLATVDVSFISLRYVFQRLHEESQTIPVIALIKPQFELTPHALDKHGVVKYPKDHLTALTSVQQFAAEFGFILVDLIPSPIRGEKSGNIEFLGYFQPMNGSSLNLSQLQECVKIAHKDV